MNDETLAALERLQAWLDADDASHFGQHEKDLQTILDHIETLRAGGERAQIVAWLRGNAMGPRWRELADAIAAGAHK